MLEARYTFGGRSVTECGVVDVAWVLVRLQRQYRIGYEGWWRDGGGPRMQSPV